MTDATQDFERIVDAGLDAITAQLRIRSDIPPTHWRHLVRVITAEAIAQLADKFNDELDDLIVVAVQERVRLT